MGYSEEKLNKKKISNHKFRSFNYLLSVLISLKKIYNRTNLIGTIRALLLFTVAIHIHPVFGKFVGNNNRNIFYLQPRNMKIHIQKKNKNKTLKQEYNIE